MVYLLPFWGYLAGCKSVSVRPPGSQSLPVWPGYDDKYRSRSYRVVQRQKPTSFEVTLLFWLNKLQFNNNNIYSKFKTVSVKIYLNRIWQGPGHCCLTFTRILSKMAGIEGKRLYIGPTVRHTVFLSYETDRWKPQPFRSSSLFGRVSQLSWASCT